MDKFYTKKRGIDGGYAREFLLIMRLSTFLILAMIMQVNATSLGQTITLTTKNEPLGNVIKEIRKQSGFDFFFSKELIEKSKPVTLNVKNASIDDVLKQCLQDQPITYKIENKAVMLKEKDPDLLNRVKDFFAVPVDVKGNVSDTTGTPLIGATVRVKGSRVSTVTDVNGNFRLPNIEIGTTLEISYVGFLQREIVVTRKNASDLNVKLKEDVNVLNEITVVSTGYQKIAAEQSTGAVSQISTKEFESRMSTDFIDGLVNRVPGLMINNQVQFTSTTPGSTTSSSRPLFNIRGISTMSANQNPLIVVDGYPTELTLDMIDPNEIASVTVLKDAAAATVYGVRASNGVIVIERKQARPGKAQFNYRSTLALTPEENYDTYRWDPNASALNVAYNSERQALVVNSGSWAALFTRAGGAVRRSAPYYIQAQLAANLISQEQADQMLTELGSYDNVNDYKRLFLRTAATQTHTLNISGGNPNALYYITANYNGRRDNQILNDDNRFLLSGRSTLRLNERFKLELTTEFQIKKDNSAPVPGVNSYAPSEHYTDENGNPAAMISGSYAQVYNNYLLSQGLLDQNYYPLVDAYGVSDKTRTLNNKTIANFTYNIGKGFNVLFGGVYEATRTEFKHLANEGTSEINAWINNYTTVNTDGSLKYNVPRGAFLRQRNSNSDSYTVRAQLNYDKKIGKHSFNGIAGAEIRNVLSKGNLSSYFGYNDGSLLQQPVDYASIFSGAAAVRGTFVTSSTLGRLDDFFGQSYNEDRFLSAFSNLVYSYNDTYSLSGSIRMDQSNLFGTDPKYKYRPLWSLGAAWNIHKESFMNNIGWLHQLRLRSSYGFNGNVAKLSLPQVVAQAQNNTSNTPALTSLILLSNANNSLRWEKTGNLNVGLEFNVFKNISGTLDFYNKKTTDVMGTSAIDPTLGASTALINYATIRNNGIEFSLKADWIARRDFNWNTGIIVAKNNSKVLDVTRTSAYNPDALDVLGYVNGYPVGAMFSYNTIGLDNQGNPIVVDQAGEQYVVNTSNTGTPIVTAMSSEASGLVTYSGTALPRYNAGLSNRVDIGNFYFFAMINYYGGFKVRVPRPTPADTRPLEGAGNFWRQAGDELNTDIPNLTNLSSANPSWAYRYNSNYVVNGDYITLGDLTASYRLNNVRFLKKAGFKNFEIKAQASNLYTVGFNRYNFSMATGSYAKRYLTPTFTLGLFTNF